MDYTRNEGDKQYRVVDLRRYGNGTFADFKKNTVSYSEESDVVEVLRNDGGTHLVNASMKEPQNISCRKSQEAGRFWINKKSAYLAHAYVVGENDMVYCIPKNLPLHATNSGEKPDSCVFYVSHRGNDLEIGGDKYFKKVFRIVPSSGR